MTNIKVISLSSFVVTLNGILGHYFAPFGVLFTPIVAITVSYLIGIFSNEITAVWKGILTYIFIGTNDLLVKLFSGGVHDQEGLGVIHLLFFVGLIPSLGILIFGILSKSTENNSIKVISILAFLLLICLHLFLFQKLGLGRSYPLN